MLVPQMKLPIGLALLCLVSVPQLGCSDDGAPEPGGAQGGGGRGGGAGRSGGGQAGGPPRSCSAEPTRSGEATYYDFADI